MDDAVPWQNRLNVWWAIWLAALLGAGLLWLIVPGPDQGRSVEELSAPPFELWSLAPLVLSILLRWGALPFTRNNRSLMFGCFLAGVVLATTAAFISLMSGEYFGRQLFTLSMLGIAQYVPLFARTFPKD